MKRNSARKPSWQFLDCSLKLQVPPRHESKKLLLIFLAAKADNFGRSYHGYASICAHLGFGSKSTVSEALKYLRNDLGVLTWEHGSGGFEKKSTNRYQLNLDAMRDVIARQNVFDPETGRLKRYEVESTQRTESGTENGLSVESTQGKVESTEAKVESTEAKVESIGDTSRVRSVYPNPQEPSEKPTPTKSNPSGGSNFFANSQTIESGRTGQQAATLPPVPNPPIPIRRIRMVPGLNLYPLDADTGQKLTWDDASVLLNSGRAVGVDQ